MKLNHTYKTSCLKGLKKLDDQSVDLIFTDPPYYQYRAQNIKGLKNHKDVVTEFDFDGFKSEEEYLQFLEDVLTECYRVCKDGGSGYLWCGDDFVSYINRIVEKVGFKFRKVIHWHKTNPFPAIHTRKMFANSMEMMVHFSKGTPKTWNHKPVNEMHNFIQTSISLEKAESLTDEQENNMPNFIQTPICMGKERKKHKTQKPLKVCIPYIEISSNEGDIVLDPFMGSGTTAIACLKTNRNYIGYEISPEYHKIIKERIKELVIESPPLAGDEGGGKVHKKDKTTFSQNNYHYNKALQPLAQKLRKNMTKAEASAWKNLFANKLMSGYQFRRQRPIDKYIVDFVCLPLGLIVEIDGATYDGSKAKEDKKRDKELKKLGFITMRFNDEDILMHINGVKNNIEDWIKANAITPPPSPRQRGKISSPNS